MSAWYLDPYSALVGAALALALMGLGYLLREPASRAWQAVRTGLRSFTAWFTAGADEQYRKAVINWAQRAHALAALGPLDSLFLSPGLVPPPPPPDLQTDALPVQESLPVTAVMRGHDRLLITGELSSGRSCLLAYLALIHAQEQAGSVLGLPAERLPLRVDLVQLDWLPLEEGRKENCLARLLESAVGSVGSSPRTRGILRQHLQAGTAVVLVDGWEELGRPEQERAAAWLLDLADSLPGNLWVVAVGPRGYAELAHGGFVPLRLEEWRRPQVETFLSRCVELVGSAEQDQDRRPPVHEATDALLRSVEKGACPLELVLRGWLLLERGEAPQGQVELFMQALDRLVGSTEDSDEAWLPDTARALLGGLALMMHEEGRATVTREEIERALERELPPPGERPGRAGARVFRVLTAAGGPLIPRGRDSYSFAHPLWQACLTARQMGALPAEAMARHMDDPGWLPVLRFYAETGQMGPVVEAWLAKSDDLWQTRLRTAARWAACAPPDAPWRSGVMVLLARTFLEPGLPDWVREQLAEALARTGDPGVPLFLRQAMRHPMEAVRAAAAQAMGCLQEHADLPALTDALEDPHDVVRAAAALALGNVGTPSAVERLAQVLADGDETLRVETARGLAYAGSSGWEMLREMTKEKDFLTRRASAYGLAEVRAPWARELLKHMAQEDSEWIVRSAAAAVLTEERMAQPARVGPPLKVSEMGWLISWAAERGEGVGTGEAALGPLVRALEEGEPAVRQAAAQALGLVGRPTHVAALRRAVQDPVPEVAEAALWALRELACRHDLVIQ